MPIIIGCVLGFLAWFLMRYLVAGLYGDSPRTVFDLDEHAFDFHVAQRDDYEGVLFIDHRWQVDAGVKKAAPERKRKPASGAKA